MGICFYRVIKVRLVLWYIDENDIRGNYGTDIMVTDIMVTDIMVTVSAPYSKSQIMVVVEGVYCDNKAPKLGLGFWGWALLGCGKHKAYDPKYGKYV